MLSRLLRSILYVRSHRGDVSDTRMVRFINGIQELSVDELADQLASLVDCHNAEKLIQKLREREKVLGADDSCSLAKAIVRLGSVFPNPDRLFSFTNAWSQAAILVHQLLLTLRIVDNV